MSTDESGDDPLLGTSLADTYILDKMIGEGGMGRVYQARHTRIAGKRFAIKLLHEEFAQHHEALERFKREAEAAALISSPYVVGVHDYGQTPDGRPFLVCDFLEGEELSERLEREGQLPIGDAVRIVRQVCAGLALAHANGVTHRDVKPENVFLTGADDHQTALLLDFGISRFREGGGSTKAALTQAGVALGTPDFMSPEQAKGKPVDHRTDIYGVGVLLYVALTGVMPFERDTPHQTLLALLTEEAPSPRTLVPSIPEHLEMVVQKAMAKEATDRYAWIAELTQALAPYDPTSGGTATPGTAATAPASTAAAPPAMVTAVSPGGTDVAEASSARGWLGVGLLVGLPSVVVGLLLAVGGVLQSADVKLETTGWLVTLLVLLVVSSTPLVLVVRHLLQAWSNTARCVYLARSVRAMTFAGAATYALGTLWLRIGYATVFDDPDALRWPLWDLVLLLAAALAAAVGFLRSRKSR
jgi:tRNA A-37 threonylcarbamoyl transferase component Bud32